MAANATAVSHNLKWQLKHAGAPGRHRSRRLSRDGGEEGPDEDGDGGPDDEGPPELLEGEAYQAVLPQLRPRPKLPPPSEARWLAHRVLAPGAWGDPSRCIRIVSATDASGAPIKCAATTCVYLTH